MFVAEYEGFRLFVYAAELKDFEAMMSRLKKDHEGFLVPVRRGAIVTPRHGFYVAYKSRKLRGRRIRKPSSIALCLLAGTHQISDAQELVGVKAEGRVQVLGVGELSVDRLEEIEERPREEEIVQVHGSSDERVAIEKAAITALRLY